VVDRKVSQKFFSSNGNRVSNPQYGTVVNSGVVSRNFDFFMVAQNCNKGTATPTYYKVIHNTSRLNEGQLQELLYGQCFNYMNWSGSVRVPGVCQYSRKLSTFVAENMKDFADTDLRINERLYYI
jgi:aubergine-like protein